jgi:acyl-CoA thioester hydrolase
MTEQKLVNFFHITPIQIRFNDIDKLDHVTNSVYQQYFDLGKMDYFNDVLQEQMYWEDVGLILASISIDFVNPIKLFDEIIVRTKIHHIGNKSLKMAQELYNKSTEKIAATSKSTMVGYNNAKEITVIIPERWRKRIITYEHDILFKV